MYLIDMKKIDLFCPYVHMNGMCTHMWLGFVIDTHDYFSCDVTVTTTNNTSLGAYPDSCLSCGSGSMIR